MDAEARAVALVRGAGPLRRALAAIAGRLVAQRAWERLGFARLADYARERPGISARSLQDLARVDGALAGLPAVEAALVAGALSWTQVRLICRVATPLDEARWVALAEGVTARALAREVRAVDAGALEAGALAGDEDGADESETACVAVRCTPRVQGLFHRARWLARRAAGEHLPSWGCMEVVAAEGLSALPGLAVEPGIETQESERRGDGSGGWGQREPVRAGPVAAPASGEGRRAAPPELPAPVCALLVRLGEADAFELDARLRRAVRLEQRIEAELAPLVREGVERALHRLRGFATLEGWARERLGVSPRKLRALLRLSRAGERWPAVADAFRSGRLSWVRAHAVLPALALARSPAERGAWLEQAASLSVRRLQEEVDAALLAAEAPAVGERQTGAEPRGRGESARSPAPEPENARFLFFGPVPVARLFRAVLCSTRRHLERTTGRAASEGEAAGWLFEHAIATWTASAGPDRRLAHAHRVFARDGWRCTVPGCTSYRNLQDHHVRFRSAGGSDALANRTTLCAFHHLRGVHAGRVRVAGTAPNRLRFDLGLRPGRAPLVSYDARERMQP